MQKQSGTLVAPIIVAIGVVIAAIAFAVVSTLLNTADSGTDLRLTRMEESLAAETAARSADSDAIITLKADLARLREEMSLLANRAPVAVQAAAPILSGNVVPMPDEDFESKPTEGLIEEMIVGKQKFNVSVSQPRNKTMMALLGPPRDNYNTDCQAVSNPALKALIETRQIGPIKVTMLKPALDSLERVLNRLKESDPDIYEKVGTAGAVCARFIRGSNTAVSNHSWGTAIDLTLDKQLDPFADGGTQFGLLILAEYFNDEGWYWGAGYRREDSMHFEVGEETLAQWKAEGKF